MKDKLIIGVDNASSSGIACYCVKSKRIILSKMIIAQKKLNNLEKLLFIEKQFVDLLNSLEKDWELFTFTEEPYFKLNAKTYGTLKSIQTVFQLACARKSIFVESVNIKQHQQYTKDRFEIKANLRKEIKNNFKDFFSNYFNIIIKKDDISDAISIALYGEKLLREKGVIRDNE